jgi:glucose-6-phosphate isomerase
LGKKLASTILDKLDDDEPIHEHDSSTNGLINYYKRNRHE